MNNVGSPQTSDVVRMEACKETAAEADAAPSAPRGVGLFRALPGLRWARVVFWGMPVQGDAVTPSPFGFRAVN